jgi:ectoine hydroxylase-related dioxygenase (phytanoyl-CoA dioxygenase family)
MPVDHLPPTASGEEIAAALDGDGVVVVDDLTDPAAMDTVRAELDPFLQATPVGPDDFSGRATRRTGGLIARSPAARELVMDPMVIDAVSTTLGHATSFHLHLTQVIAIGAGEPAQQIHRDQWAFDFFPFPSGYDVQCNTIWAMTDFTEANGATRVVPGSHRDEDHQRYGPDDTVAAEMARGSALFYLGSVYHGGGANRTDETRMGVNITYAVSWLRQEENQYLTVPQEVARDLPLDLLKVMGYDRGAYALGYIDDLRHPLEALGIDTQQAGFGNVTDDELGDTPSAQRLLDANEP